MKAPSAPTGENPTLAWYGAHELFLWDSRTDSTRKLADISGVTVPTWSHDGARLLYVAADGLWLVSPATGVPVEVEHPLFPDQEWRAVARNQLSFFGQIPWTAHFSWWSPLTPNHASIDDRARRRVGLRFAGTGIDNRAAASRPTRFASKGDHNGAFGH